MGNLAIFGRSLTMLGLQRRNCLLWILEITERIKSLSHLLARGEPALSFTCVSGGRKKKSLCSSFCSMLRLTKEGATPVNWRVVMLVVFTLVSANFTFTMVDPWVLSEKRNSSNAFV